jgi:hypothetical protein
MISPGGGPLENEGANPPRGAVIRYFIRDELDEQLTIEVISAAGQVVRRYSSEESDFARCIIGNKDQRLPFEVKYPTTNQGANQWEWDLRRNELRCIDDIKIFEGYSGAYVSPGEYTVKVTVGKAVDSAAVTLVADRRIEVDDGRWLELESTVVAVTEMMNEIIDKLGAARLQRELLETLLKLNPESSALAVSANRATKRLDDWEKKVYQVDYETYEDVGHLPGKLMQRVRHLLNVIDSAKAPVSVGALERFSDLQAEWSTLRAEFDDLQAADIATINQWAKQNDLPHVVRH